MAVCYRVIHSDGSCHKLIQIRPQVTPIVSTRIRSVPAGQGPESVKLTLDTCWKIASCRATVVLQVS